MFVSNEMRVGNFHRVFVTQRLSITSWRCMHNNHSWYYRPVYFEVLAQYSLFVQKMPLNHSD